MTAQTYKETECLSLTVNMSQFKAFDDKMSICKLSEKFKEYELVVQLRTEGSQIIKFFKQRGGCESDDDEFCIEVWSLVTLKDLLQKYGWRSHSPLMLNCQMNLIKVDCGVKLLESSSASSLATNFENSLIKDVDRSTDTSYWSLDDTADFTIECRDGSMMKVHRHILLSRCLALGRKFSKFNHVEEIRVLTADPRVVREMVRFIYTNELDETDGIEKDIIEIAAKLEVEGLATACTSKLLKNISVESAVKCLILGHQNNLIDLKSRSMPFVIKNSKEIRQHESWKTIVNHPELVMEVLCQLDDSKS